MCMLSRVLLVLLLRASTSEISRLEEIDDFGMSRVFVVTKGCPQQLETNAKVRLFVAVPSALMNLRRRQWIRATWCQSAHFSEIASTAVSFFVGSNQKSTISDEIQTERNVYGDIVVVPSWDDVDNVTAKQLHTMRFFAALHGDIIWDSATKLSNLSYPTHYARFEDDVYPRLPLLLKELVNGQIHTFPGPEIQINPQDLFVWAFFVQENATYPYPCGGGMILSANLVRAIAIADALAPFDVGAPRPEHCSNSSQPPCKPTAHGKGGYGQLNGWSTDDSFLGLMLRPYRYRIVNDRRFHDPLGSTGLNAWPASNYSLAIQGLRSWQQFHLLHNALFDDFNRINQSATDSIIEYRPNGDAIVWMEVDGRKHGLFIHGCSQVHELAHSTCQYFKLDDRMCTILRSYFFNICPQVEAWKIATAAPAVR